MAGEYDEPFAYDEAVSYDGAGEVVPPPVIFTAKRVTIAGRDHRATVHGSPDVRVTVLSGTGSRVTVRT